MKISKILATTAIASCISLSAYAEELPDYKTETLTGNWNGARDSLAKAGVTTDVIYKFDVMGNASGGIKQGVRELDNLDVLFNIDGEKLFNSHGTSALIYLLNNNGGRPDADLVGSAQGVDNIETSVSTAKLYQAWVQQNLFDDNLSVLAGLYDLNSEFYVNDTSGLFIHSTYGIGTDMSQSGVNGPSIFPTTSAAVRLKIAPIKEFYAQAAVLDAVSGSQKYRHGTHIDFNKNDGELIVGELGYIPGGEAPSGKIAVGAWYYTEESDDLLTVDGSGNPVRKNNQGAYIIAEHEIYANPGSKGQGLSAFGRLGFADKNINQFDYAWSAGLVYTGLIPNREDGKLGFGIAGAHNSNKYKEVASIAESPVDSSETALELTYSDNITKWFSVQPDVQYIINPSTNKSLDNALVIGSRFTIKF